MFGGSIVALVAPMHASGEIDLDSFRQLILWHIESGTQAIVVNGTTGESASLTSAEKLQLLSEAVKAANGRVPIIAGTGTSSTAATIQEIRAAASCGVDACLVVTPYYNRPTQHGLYQHYKAVADSTELPMLTYNVPRRTGCDLLPETMARLAEVKNIVGIKEATGDLVRVAAFKALVGDRFILLSGDDATAMDFMRQGGQGVISVSANVAPTLMQQMCAATLAQEYELAQNINSKLALLHTALMSEPNPIPVKWALHKLAKIDGGLRLPLTELSQPLHSMLLKALEQLDMPAASTEVSMGAVG